LILLRINDPFKHLPNWADWQEENCIAQYLVKRTKIRRMKDIPEKLKGLIVENSESNSLRTTDNG